ncbi:tRNA-dihydrouridine synthase, partial [Salmonella enterica subsp. enterica serovar Virginia]|nr:tRNA-dihydrouridine synthase [Salmonella enterica subsp. enterica serovar Virginia]
IVGLTNTAFTLRVSFTTLPLKQWTVRFALDSQVKKHFDLANVPLPLAEVKRLLCTHVRELHDFYGQAKGYRIARKHVSWYLQEH